MVAWKLSGQGVRVAGRVGGTTTLTSMDICLTWPRLPDVAYCETWLAGICTLLLRTTTTTTFCKEIIRLYRRLNRRRGWTFSQSHSESSQPMDCLVSTLNSGLQRPEIVKEHFCIPCSTSSDVQKNVWSAKGWELSDCVSSRNSDSFQ